MGSQDSLAADIPVPFRSPAHKAGALAETRDDLPLVYFVGDSHVSVFSGSDRIDAGFPAVTDSRYPNVRVCRLGACLAATMHRLDTTEGGRAKALAVLPLVEPGSTVFLSFGEIDCRAHIPKRSGFSEQGLAGAVESALENFFSFVDDYRDLAGKRDIRIGLLSPPPTASFDSGPWQEALMRLLERAVRNPVGRASVRTIRSFLPKRPRMLFGNALNATYSGHWMLRNTAARMFRDAFEDYCARNGLAFVDMFGPFVEADGRSAASWFMDEIHLSRHAIAAVSEDFARNDVPNFLRK